MNFSGLFRLVCLTAAFVLPLCPPVHAENLQERIDGLEVLPLPYGATHLKIKGENAIIVKGIFENGNAWGGDIYTVLVQQENNWQMVRHENKDTFSGVLTNTLPHGDEDSIESVRFMVPKGAAKSGNISALFLLEAVRNYMPNPSGVPGKEEMKTPVTLTLNVVRREDDFGILYFHELAKTVTKKEYCNVEQAMNKELGVAFPDNAPSSYGCVK